MAPVRAAAVGIERPLERHPLDPVQRRPAAHLLVLRRVGAQRRLVERVRAAFPYEVGDLASRGFRFAEIEEKRRRFPWRIRLFRRMFAMEPITKVRVRRLRRAERRALDGTAAPVVEEVVEHAVERKSAAPIRLRRGAGSRRRRGSGRRCGRSRGRPLQPSPARARARSSASSTIAHRPRDAGRDVVDGSRDRRAPSAARRRAPCPARR